MIKPIDIFLIFFIFGMILFLTYSINKLIKKSCEKTKEKVVEKIVEKKGKWNCVLINEKKHCVESDTGIYNSKLECESNCVKYTRNKNGNCITDNNGEYFTKNDCEKSKKETRKNNRLDYYFLPKLKKEYEELEPERIYHLDRIKNSNRKYITKEPEYIDDYKFFKNREQNTDTQKRMIHSFKNYPPLKIQK